jgi:hypothetical protein
MLKTVKIAALCLGLLLITGQGAWAQNYGGGSSAEFACSGFATGELDFFGLGDAFVYSLTPFLNGKAAVSTADCCIFGPDIWRAALHEAGANKKGKSKAGDGTTCGFACPGTAFSGTVSRSVQVGRSYRAVLTADTIPGGFIAGMHACFTGPVFVGFLGGP